MPEYNINILLIENEYIMSIKKCFTVYVNTVEYYIVNFDVRPKILLWGEGSVFCIMYFDYASGMVA